MSPCKVQWGMARPNGSCDSPCPSSPRRSGCRGPPLRSSAAACDHAPGAQGLRTPNALQTAVGGGPLHGGRAARARRPVVTSRSRDHP